MRKVLIVKLGAIGDVIMALPAVHKLYELGADIDWVCGSAVKPLLEGYPWINLILADDKSILKGTGLERIRSISRLWGSLAGRRYDLCANLYYDPRYRLLTLPVVAKRKVFLSRTSRQTLLIPGRHHTDEYARILLDRPDSVQPESLAPLRPDRLPELNRDPNGATIRVALVPGGASNMLRQQTLRQWPIESYVQLARILTARGWEVMLLGGPDDGWVKPYFADIAVSDRIGDLSLPEVILACDNCDAVVTHDTGPLHLAGLSQTPLIGLFGPTDPATRLPRRQHTSAIWGGEGFACRPCYDGRDFAPCLHNGCMRQITPESVLREIDRVLEQKRQAEGSLPSNVASATDGP